MFRPLRLPGSAIAAFLALAAPAVRAAPPLTIEFAPSAVLLPSPGGDHDTEARVERRIGELRTRLQITAEQRDAWAAFAGVMRSNARRMDDTARLGVADPLTVPADLGIAAFAQEAARHAEEIGALVGPFQALYRLMSAPQKAVADRLFRAEAHGGDLTGRN